MKKQILRWIILGGTLFFLAKAIKDNWREVANIHIDTIGWAILVIATGVTLLAHTWAGWIWTWVLQELNQQIDSSHFIRAYLKTNIAKYVPGNVWHYYGRIVVAKEANVTTSAATLSVLLEPLLMAAAAVIVIVVFVNQFATPNISNNFTQIYNIIPSLTLPIFKLLAITGILTTFHPRFLNPIIAFLQKLKLKKSTNSESQTNPTTIQRYPILPLLGEIGFLGLRATGFFLTIFALSPLHLHQIPLLFAAFCSAWLLGLIVPGAPGGLGVFEATAIALLQNRFPTAVVISSIVLYRLISILAETIGAALASLDEQLENY